MSNAMSKERFSQTAFIFYKPVIIEYSSFYKAALVLDIDDKIDSHTPIHYEDFHEKIVRNLGTFKKADDKIYEELYNAYHAHHREYPVSWNDESFDYDVSFHEEEVKLNTRKAVRISKQEFATIEDLKKISVQRLQQCSNIFGKKMYHVMSKKVQQSLRDGLIIELGNDFIIYWE